MHRHSVDPLSLSLAQGAAANVSGGCLVRAKKGTASGSWAALIAPTAHGPTGWSVLHRHSVDPLSLSLARGAAANVSGGCLVRAKKGIASGSWTALIAPTAHSYGRWLGANCIPALHLVVGGRPPTPTYLYRIRDLIRHCLFSTDVVVLRHVQF